MGARSSSKRQGILVIGPTPPPFHGVSVATDLLLQSDIGKHYRLRHVDLADRRGIRHVDNPDVHDVVLFLRQWFRLAIRLLAERPLLVYLALSQSTIGFLRDSFFIWPSSWTGGRIVAHMHGGNFRAWYESRNTAMKWYVKRVMKRITHVVVLGESLRCQFNGLVAPKNISVVPNGIASFTRHSPSEIPPLLAATQRHFRILHLSTLNRLKGALVFLESIASIVEQRKDVDFILAGPWSVSADQREAEAMIATKNIGRYVRFTGQVAGRDKWELLQSVDIFVFPGVQQEGQPLVVLEAMAAGLPVLFTDRGCLRETVIDGETGLEVRLEDPQHLADRLSWLLDHPEEMQRMGENARARFEAFYTEDRFVEGMTHVFQHVAKEAA